MICHHDNLRPGTIGVADLGYGDAIVIGTCADCGADVESVRQVGPRPPTAIGAEMMTTSTIPDVPLTLGDLRASIAALPPPTWQATAFVMAPDVAASYSTNVTVGTASSPFAGIRLRVLPALTPGHAFVEEKLGGRVRYRRLLPTEQDACPCPCHGDSEEGDPHDDGDCCPDLEDGDREFMGVDLASDATDAIAYVAHVYERIAKEGR